MASKIVLTSSERGQMGVRRRGGRYSRLAVAIVTGARSVFEEYLLLMTYKDEMKNVVTCRLI